MSSGSDGQNAAVVEMVASAPQQVFSRKYERTALQVVAIGLVCESDMVTSESAMVTADEEGVRVRRESRRVPDGARGFGGAAFSPPCFYLLDKRGNA